MKNKCCVWLVVLLFMFVATANAQMVRIDGGVAFSKLKTKGLDGNQILDKSVKPFQMSLGLEYLEREYFNLSSSVGYLRAGGRSDIPVVSSIGQQMVDYKCFIDYLTVNTLFNIKRSVRRETYYVGIGPRLDFKLDAKETEVYGVHYANGNKPVVFGLKCEAGFWYDLDDHFCLGANVGYLPSFTKTWTSPVNPDVTMATRSFTLGVSLGYRL